MEPEFRLADEEINKPKARREEKEEEEKMEQEVAGNDAVKETAAGSAGELDLLGKNAARPMAMPTSGVDATNFGSSQLTIFYGGKVCVFDAIRADKVQEIMLIATAAAAAFNTCDIKSIGTNCCVASPILTRSSSLQSTGSALPSPRAQPFPVQRNSFCKLQAELPMARRHSLQRFFEKRRDRLVSKNPYAAQSGTKMSEDTKSNLIAEASADSGYCQTPPIPGEGMPPKAAADVA